MNGAHILQPSAAHTTARKRLIADAVRQACDDFFALHGRYPRRVALGPDLMAEFRPPGLEERLKDPDAGGHALSFEPKDPSAPWLVVDLCRSDKSGEVRAVG